MQTSHWRQYPPNTTTVYSYFESRGGKFDEVCFFGLQYIIKRYLTGQVVTKEKIDAAEVARKEAFAKRKKELAAERAKALAALRLERAQVIPVALHAPRGGEGGVPIALYAGP